VATPVAEPGWSCNRPPPYHLTQRSHDTIEVDAAIVGGESDGHDADALDPRVTFTVVRTRIRFKVLTAINFNSKFQFWTIKIDNVPADAMLSSKFVAATPALFQLQPKRNFCGASPLT
jgi:hypothetical protein